MPEEVQSSVQCHTVGGHTVSLTGPGYLISPHLSCVRGTRTEPTTPVWSVSQNDRERVNSLAKCAGTSDTAEEVPFSGTERVSHNTEYNPMKDWRPLYYESRNDS